MLKKIMIIVVLLVLGGCVQNAYVTQTLPPTQIVETEAPVVSIVPVIVAPTATPTPEPTKIPATVPKGWVDATESVPNLIVDLKFAGSDNFLGKPATGYNRSDVAIMRTVTAEKLANAQKLFNEQGLTIYIFDTYRPQTAVNDFMKWIKQPDDPETKAKYYPNISKSKLKGKYIAGHSQHSKGYAVDITIADLETGEPLDMGAIYLFFGDIGHYNTKGITDEQMANRKLLKTIMNKAGFKGISQEWWHFQISNDSKKYYGFPIE